MKKKILYRNVSKILLFILFRLFLTLFGPFWHVWPACLKIQPDPVGPRASPARFQLYFEAKRDVLSQSILLSSQLIFSQVDLKIIFKMKIKFQPENVDYSRITTKSKLRREFTLNNDEINRKINKDLYLDKVEFK